MKLNGILPASLMLLAGWAMPPGAAKADTVMYDGISLIQGQQSSVQSFNVATAGTLTFSLSAIPWLDTVSNLTGFLSNASGELGTTVTGAGTESYDVGAGTYYAHWFGDAQGTYNLGVVGMKVDFQPTAGTPVSLPTSLILLLSGLGVLFGWQGRRASSTAPAAAVA